VCWRSVLMVETSVAVVTPCAVAISRRASQNASSRVMLVLCPAMVIDLLKTRDFCVPPFMKHPHQVAPLCERGTIGRLANHATRIVGGLMLSRDARRPFLWPYWSQRLCGSTAVTAGRFNLTH
jgi:hypothetical protein